MKLHLQGLIAAVFSPFDRARPAALDLSAVERQYASLRTHQVAGAYVCGTTGEFPSMTLDERMAVAARWREVAAPDWPVIVNVTHTAQADAARLAAHAREIKATGVAAMLPAYLRPATAGAAAAFLAPVAAAAGDLPFFYYHYPDLSGCRLPLYDVLEALPAPNLAGAKFSSEDFRDLARCHAAFGDKLDLLLGGDDLMLHHLVLGGRAFVGATFNFAAPMYRRLLQAWEGGDLDAARAEQRQAAELLRVTAGYGGLRAWKAIMAMTGVDVGPVRPPLAPMPDEERAALFADLGEHGFFRPL